MTGRRQHPRLAGTRPPRPVPLRRAPSPVPCGVVAPSQFPGKPPVATCTAVGEHDEHGDGTYRWSRRG